MTFTGKTLQTDAEVLEQEVGDAEGDIDFFLTADWPAGVTALCPPASAPKQEVLGEQLMLWQGVAIGSEPLFQALNDAKSLHLDSASMDLLVHL